MDDDFDPMPPRGALRSPSTGAEIASDRDRRFAEAEEAREQWAKSHGCASFTQALAIGLNNLGKRHT